MKYIYELIAGLLKTIGGLCNLAFWFIIITITGLITFIYLWDHCILGTM